MALWCRREYERFMKESTVAWAEGEQGQSSLPEKRMSKRKSLSNRKSRVSFR